MSKIVLTPSALLVLIAAPTVGLGVGLLATSFFLKRKIS